jgi:hypothetical protein
MMEAIATSKPPTMPPAIAPPFELWPFGVAVRDAVEEALAEDV